MADPEALAFDMYGTLVDPIRIWTRLEQYAPDEALRIAEGGVLFMYQRFIADITVSIVHVTECLDGAASASQSHFPVTTPG